jgi:hypothetical protein
MSDVVVFAVEVGNEAGYRLTRVLQWPVRQEGVSHPVEGQVPDEAAVIL